MYSRFRCAAVRQCGSMLEPMMDKTEESDVDSEQGRVVADELSTGPSRKVTEGPSEDRTTQDMNHPGESVVTDIGPSGDLEEVTCKMET